MSLRIFAVALGLAAAGAGAAVPRPTQVVVLSNFDFRPSRLDLRAGVPVVLAFRNDSGSGHSFSAPAFFASSRMDPQSAASVRSGRVEVPAHSQVAVELTPAPGQYKLKCSHLFHAMLGMTGTIVVS